MIVNFREPTGGYSSTWRTTIMKCPYCRESFTQGALDFERGFESVGKDSRYGYFRHRACGNTIACEWLRDRSD